MAGVRTSVIWMLSNTRLGRQTPRKSRASTSIYGHGSSDWYAAQSVSPRRNRCTIWSSGSSSIGTSLGEQSDTGSTDLKHLPSIHVRPGVERVVQDGEHPRVAQAPPYHLALALALPQPIRDLQAM